MKRPPRGSSPHAAAVLACFVLAACAPVKTTYVARFHPPDAWISVGRDRIAPDRVDPYLVELGVREAARLGHDVVFVDAVATRGCLDTCYLYRPKFTDDLYLALTARTGARHFSRWFWFSPMDDGSPVR
jgi:hypothetical protein